MYEYQRKTCVCHVFYSKSHRISQPQYEEIKKSSTSQVSYDNSDSVFCNETSIPKSFSRNEPNDFITDLDHPGKRGELLVLRLKGVKKNIY